MVTHRPGVTRYIWWVTLLWSVGLLGGAVLALLRAFGHDVMPTPPATFAPFALAGFLFFGERFLRSRVFGPDSVGPAGRQWRIACQVLREEGALFLRRSSHVGETVFGVTDRSRVVMVWRDKMYTVAQLESAACCLGRALPTGKRVLVACDDRAVFFWSVLACWAGNRTVVLPPADLNHMVVSAGDAYFDCVITDRPEFSPTRELPVHVVDGAQLLGLLCAAPAHERRIALRGSDLAAIFFTSGSTGKPIPHAKQWSQLRSAADAMSELLHFGREPVLLAATVVHSHMFGFEMLIMQAVRGRATMYAHRIAYPTDLAAFVDSRGECKWLATTPYHLGVFVEANQWTPGLQRIISATMPLHASLARIVESASDAEVHEIYGSTEAGCIATRRTSVESTWRPSPDIRLTVNGSGTTSLHATRVGGILQLRDQIVLVPGGFKLCGRDTDLVKIAGKRTSLEALTTVLRAIDGVLDGCFVDGATIGQKRLVAVAVAPRVSTSELREALAAQIDAVFLPRPLLIVDQLPRDANGKLRIDLLPWESARTLQECSTLPEDSLRSNAA
ncbi:MAG: class I adenylate-forming enzyme family protein [Vicinamibacterales bacterium]